MPSRPAPVRRPARRRVALGAALALLALPAGAHASGGLLIAPSSVDASVRAGRVLPAIRVTNDTGRDLVLWASALRARQELSGLPVYRLDARARRAGRAFVRVRPARFTLRAGASREVSATVVARHPAVGRGGYGVVLFEALPRRASGARNAVTARLRLTANLLLRYPSARRPARVHGVARSLRAEQGPADPRRTLRLLVRVHGAGTIHGRPQARLRIRDARGRVVARAPFTTGNVLPGADRELPVLVETQLPAGRYTARAIVRSGGHTSTATLPLRLVGKNVLPTPDLRIAGLPSPHPDRGRPFTAELGLVNRGSAAAAVRGWWQVRSAGGQRLIAHGRLAGAPLPAGARRGQRLRLPGMAAGQWRLVVALEGPGRELDRRELVFATGERLGWWTRFEDWAAANVPLLLAAFAALLLLLLTLAAAYTARLRRRLAAGSA